MKNKKQKILLKIFLAAIFVVIFSSLRSGSVYASMREWSMDTSLNDADSSFLPESTGKRYGRTLANIGNVNGDEYDDFLIGNFTDNGEVYLVFGNSDGWAMNTNLSTAGASFTGVGGSQFGSTVAGLGDVNGDGLDDFAIGAYLADANGQSEAGETYIVFGKTSDWSQNQNITSAASASFEGEGTSYKTGWSIDGAGDVNNDGYDDILIGSWQYNAYSGRSYLIYGKPSGWDLDSSLGDVGGTIAGASFNGESATYSAWELAGIGDIDDDDYDDFAIGAPRYSALNGNELFVFYGKSNASWTANMSIGTAKSVSLSNRAQTTWLGADVSGAGDLNGDGIDDFVIGTDGSSATAAYVVFGSTSGLGTGDVYLWELADATAYTGETTSDHAGFRVGGIGDVNNDGYNDFVVGAFSNSDGSTERGQAYLVFGKSTGWGTSVSLSDADASFLGEDAYDEAGRDVAGGGDFNNDGADDILIGAYRDEEGGDVEWTGQTYLIEGNPYNITPTDTNESFYPANSPGSVVLNFTNVTDGIVLSIDAGSQSDIDYLGSSDLYTEHEIIPIDFTTGDQGIMYYYFGTSGPGSFESYKIRFIVDPNDLTCPWDWYHIWHYDGTNAPEIATGEVKGDAGGGLYYIEGTLTSFSGVGVGANPEPGTMVLFGVGLAGLGWKLRKKRNRKGK